MKVGIYGFLEDVIKLTHPIRGLSSGNSLRVASSSSHCLTNRFGSRLQQVTVRRGEYLLIRLVRVFFLR